MTALAAAVLAVGIAVASSTIPGHAVPGMTAPDWPKLQPGPYPSAPIDYAPDFTDAEAAYRMESRRMLDYLASPDEIDPDVTYLGGTHLLDTSDENFGDPRDPFSANVSFPKNWQPIAEQNRLIAGVSIERSNNSFRTRKYITLALLRFPTEQAAAAAANGFADALAAPGLHPIPIAGIDARASSISDAKGQIFASRGVYTIVGHAIIPQPDATALGQRLEAMVQAQFAKMAELKPTPLEDIPDLATDPDGLLRRTLPNKFNSADSDSSGGFGSAAGGIYIPAGALHYERDAVAARKAFAEAGVDRVARNAATVYRTRDLAAAFRLQAALMKPGRDDDVFPNPPGLPDASCLQLGDPEPTRNATYLCAVVYDRYVAVIGAQAEFSGGEPASFPQRVAAQYLMLAKSG